MLKHKKVWNCYWCNNTAETAVVLLIVFSFLLKILNGICCCCWLKECDKFTKDNKKRQYNKITQAHIQRNVNFNHVWIDDRWEIDGMWGTRKMHGWGLSPPNWFWQSSSRPTKIVKIFKWDNIHKIFRLLMSFINISIMIRNWDTNNAFNKSWIYGGMVNKALIAGGLLYERFW